MFKELLETKLHPIEEQRIARERFPSLLAQSNLLPWREMSGKPAQLRIVICAAADYSRPDLELLDIVDMAIASQRLPNCAVEVFTVSDVSRMEDFEKYIPGITPVGTTPVVGIWNDGVLVAKDQGLRAREMIYALIRGPEANRVSPPAE